MFTFEYPKSKIFLIMKYLTPEIAALSKNVNGKSLARTNMSCGIFQDCDYTETRPKLYHQLKLENKAPAK